MMALPDRLSSLKPPVRAANSPVLAPVVASLCRNKKELRSRVHILPVESVM
ncbi:MAG: hypothetical protein V3V55_08615 [Rhodospirillales bacterium]